MVTLAHPHWLTREEGGTGERGGDSVLCTWVHKEVPNGASEDNHPKGGVPDARVTCPCPFSSVETALSSRRCGGVTWGGTQGR